MHTDTWITTSTRLGVLALTAVLVSLLALTDIYHGEADVSSEWNALRACFAIIIVSQVSSLVTLRKVSRRSSEWQN